MKRTTKPLCFAVVVLMTSAASAAEFHMIHATRGNASIGAFATDGPRLGAMQKAPSRVDFIAYDPHTETYFGQQVSKLGVIKNGVLTPIETPATVQLSHAGGLAFDTSRESVLVASRDGGGTVLFEYTPAANSWNEIGNIGRDDFRGLACDGEQGTIYVLHKPHMTRGCTNLRVFNRQGAQVGAVDLSTPIPFYPELRPKLQFAFADGALYALISFERKHPRAVDSIYAIDPASGEVSRTPYNAGVDLTSKTWPGWQEGPAPSAPKSVGGARGSGTGFYSNYQTPRPLVARQAGELHVLSVETGDMKYIEWLKKIKKIRASSRPGGGVTVELDLDLDAKVQHPVVEVFVEKTRQPATLALVSRSPVVWSIEAAPGAKIAKVMTFGAPFHATSQVVGVQQGIVVAGGQIRSAHAWELDKSSSACEFDEMIKTIRNSAGLRENSFQGLGRGTAFRVQSN